MIIAIDGPAGSGKSTVAKLIAHELGFQYLDTGAMYRAVAFRSLQEGIEPDEEADTIRIATDEPIEFGRFGAGSVSIGGLDVTENIRTAAVDKAVSSVSAIAGVRSALVSQQRKIGETTDVVMEGRDIGTVVFPQAQVKVFLTATPEARAHRRAEQNVLRGIGDTDEEAILRQIRERDEQDSGRELAPLKCADDAVSLDTSDMSIDEVVAFIGDLAKSRMR